jgi:hypothetical protein
MKSIEYWVSYSFAVNDERVNGTGAGSYIMNEIRTGDDVRALSRFIEEQLETQQGGKNVDVVIMNFIPLKGAADSI